MTKLVNRPIARLWRAYLEFCRRLGAWGFAVILAIAVIAMLWDRIGK